MPLHRKDHRPAILRRLKRSPASLAQLVSYLKASNVDAIEYDLRRLRAAGEIVPQRAPRKWRLA